MFLKSRISSICHVCGSQLLSVSGGDHWSGVGVFGYSHLVEIGGRTSYHGADGQSSVPQRSDLYSDRTDINHHLVIKKASNGENFLRFRMLHESTNFLQKPKIFEATFAILPDTSAP